MIVLQGVEVKLKEAKAGDMVTVEKLASIDEKKVSNYVICARQPCLKTGGRVLQSGYVAFGHFLTGFFKWMDPELGTNAPSVPVANTVRTLTPANIARRFTQTTSRANALEQQCKPAATERGQTCLGALW